LSVSLETAIQNGEPFWSVLAHAVRYGAFRAARAERVKFRATRFFVDPALIEATAAEQRTEERLPWNGAERLLPPGKLEHVRALYPIAEWVDLFDDAQQPDRIQPLMSQPLVELLLRVPTYVLTTGGEDRTVARRAFARDLPPALLSRRTKGTTNEFRLSVFRKTHDWARELLLDGILVREKLLDRKRVERALSTPATSAGLMNDYANMEIWLRSWLWRTSADGKSLAA